MSASARASEFARSIPGFWTTLFRVYRKDTALEWRSPVSLLSVILFSLILAVIYNYALTADVFSKDRNLYGIMLATLFFAATFIPARNIQYEKEGGALQLMLQSPADAAGFYLGKVVALWQLQILFILVYVPLYFILLQGKIPAAASLLVPISFLVAAALSLAATGVLLSYIASGNRLREVILPLLLLPATLPVLMLVADAMARFEVQAGLKSSFPWIDILILLAPAGIFNALGSMVYHITTADE